MDLGIQDLRTSSFEAGTLRRPLRSRVAGQSPGGESGYHTVELSPCKSFVGRIASNQMACVLLACPIEPETCEQQSQAIQILF